MKHVRNIAIVLALGAIVYAAPGAGRAAGVLAWLLGVVFLGTLAWFAAMMYRQYRGELYSLGDRMRLVLYGSIGLAVLTLTATRRLWETGAGTVIWFGLLVAASAGVYTAVRSYQSY